MATAPYGVRLLVGAATVAVEETLKLPRTVLMCPMTLASQVAHIVMRFQQNLAGLVTKGDGTLETLFPAKSEQPEWATFDEDLTDTVDETPTPLPVGDVIEIDCRSEERFALYSVSDTSEPEDADSLTQSMPTRHVKKAAAKLMVHAPEVADDIDYPALTLAQLRGKLQSLDLGELEALLVYEQATKARAPFQTLLANRITSTTAK
ncbi:hypothetical protein JK2ML_1939 [Mycobacterium leprae Kyoto-2]|uniref:Lipid droplet-associated protein n=3 Tax=Mycobacterium leprae TaxID=1769 RepID=Q7AQ17_MYCLE|nr:lipid droplet-associated protein [Mycobacterium leprae]CAR72036.1 conserved hypothetical protein [Mycobacterium leprae Br4923]AWV48354.1 hypothetical protein DIJ64_10665 [Mycobacterium leprae]OAR20167.1 hypothetical protein A8144_11960 [Mycobacterium leprae 3125609]OAX70518.1 hypothetical protein A3216_11595 [Mycobacterium leprae 7935681]CAB39813.1 hypothetical protein MLCB1222.07 [Mycobacterium leprae]